MAITNQALMGIAKRFINDQNNGAGTWPDGAEVSLPGQLGSLRIIDTVGNNKGFERHIEVWRGERKVGTLVYSHTTRLLIREDR